MAVLEKQLKQQAHALGFDLVGIAPAVEADGFEHLRDWLERGHAGEMSYLHKHAEARRHPASILPGVRSVIMVAMNYNVGASGVSNDPGSSRHRGVHTSRSLGKVARYAQGPGDYHDVLWERLSKLLCWLQEQAPGCNGRAVVDTAPLLERDFARRAGLGWIGKNTMLLNKHLGSYFFLGALLVDLELKPDPPHEASHCGTCAACLDACPTQAFPEPGVLDARRCISYLTIELRGPVPEDLRPQIGDWLFGCDVCQEVCPWNHDIPSTPEPAFQPLPEIDPIELLSLTEEEFRRRFKPTALWRTRRRGLFRNACLVLGNRGTVAALPLLQQTLSDPDPVIRDAAAWAIARINGQKVTN